MQNRFGGVPTAQNGYTKSCLFRKPLAMMLLLAALVMAGGKAWGQTQFPDGFTFSAGGPAWNFGYGNEIFEFGADVIVEAPINIIIVPELPATNCLTIRHNIFVNHLYTTIIHQTCNAICCPSSH